MATFMLLLYGPEGGWDATPEEVEAQMTLHQEFSKTVEAHGGKVLGGEALERPSTAKLIRTTGETVVTDGPYADTKEQLGGFYLIEADSMETAVAIARRSPEPVTEVRQVVAFDDE